MSADIQEIIQITTTQLNQVFKEQDAMTKKIDALRTSTKNDIQILAKHLKSMESKISPKEEVLSQEMEKLLDEKISQTFEKMIENVKIDIESRIKEAFDAGFEGLKSQMTEIQKKVEDVENNQKNDDFQSLLEDSNKRLEAFEVKFEQNNQEFLRIQDEKLRLFENNNTFELVKLGESIEDVQKEMKEISNNGEKQRDEFLEMIENMKNNLNESSLKNMMMKEIQGFGFGEEIQQLKLQIEESDKRFENDQTASAQKTKEIMTKIDENLNQQQEISERIEKLESWIQDKSYEDALNERIEAIRKEVMDVKETFEDKLEGFLERGEVENDINQIRNEFTSTMEKSKEEVAEQTKEVMAEIESKIKNNIHMSLEDIQQRSEKALESALHALVTKDELEKIQEKGKHDLEEAIQNCSEDLEGKVKMLFESQEKAIGEIQKKLDAEKLAVASRFSENSNELGKLEEVIKTLQTQSVTSEEKLNSIDHKFTQLKEQIERVENKQNESFGRLSKSLEELTQNNTSEEKLEELTQKYNDMESIVAELKAANGMEKAIEEIREEIEVVKGTQNNMFGGFKKIEDDAREKELEFSSLIESGMKKLEESASTIQANMEAEILKMKEEMNLIADKLKQELSENDDAIRHDVQKIEMALVSEEKVNQLLSRIEETSNEKVNNIKTEISEQIRSLRREMNDDDEASIVRMNSLEKQIEELSNDVQSEKKKSENNIAVYEESMNDVKTETNEKCKIMLKKLENMSACIQTVVDKEINSLNKNFEDRLQNFKTLIEEQLRNSRGSQQEIVDDGKLSDEESMNQIAGESVKTETAESETQFKEDFVRLKNRYESYQSEIDSLKDEIEDIKKNYQNSFEDLKKENVEVSEKVTECERNTQAILQSIGEQEEKLRTLILSEEDRENSSTMICSKRESIKSLDDELITLEEKLKVYLISELGKSVTDMEQRLEEDTDKKIENINEIVKEVKSLLVTFGRDRVFQDENTMRNFVIEIAQKVTEDILKKRDEEEEQNSVQKCPFGFEEQNGITDLGKKAKYNSGSDPMMTSLWETIGLINARINGIEADLNAKTASLRAVSTPY